MLADLQKNGANARALGISEFDNPFYKASEMPGSTGESLEDWQEKVIAWRTGWKLEDAVRG